ncbi:hypothetical protein [Prauserella halophila]|nr:hypothetical protein [Prauserella halophila]
MVRSKAHGKGVNDGKTETAQRAVPLATWLVSTLLDRRSRVVEDRGQAPEDVVGWVFPDALGGLRETNTCGVTGEHSATATTSVPGSRPGPSGTPSRLW